MKWYQLLALLLFAAHTLYVVPAAIKHADSSGPRECLAWAFSLCLACAAFFGVTACSNTNLGAANAAAEDFVKRMPEATGFSCADQDTDGDGYVTCTVFRRGLDPIPIQCGSERYCVNCARGCKYVPVKVDRAR